MYVTAIHVHPSSLFEGKTTSLSVGTCKWLHTSLGHK